jgi:hypothetical protein
MFGQPVRSGQTTSSELPPPLDEPVALPPLGAPRAARVRTWRPAWTFALSLALLLGAIIVLLRR